MTPVLSVYVVGSRGGCYGRQTRQSPRVEFEGSDPKFFMLTKICFKHIIKT